MDPEISSLAQGAGATLVTLMVTDAWERAREGVTRIWRHVQPERADSVAAELEVSREDVLAAHAADDRQSMDELRAQWQGRLRRLLVAHPEAAEELRRLLDAIDPASAGAAPTVTQHATASGQARVYQAGRDQHSTER
ncbi:hypothetical protein [Streptomyces sp. NRRL F-5135]|uniref:hypothetical protein n=1 Tax=Streptomyces sp. NRRL F-5135 TaxID=1463858 RepID=UPI0004CBEC1E|nr:hypothetical protein [Streptomyces sp. NRRL F-5135]